jgi:hypothetical protein
VCICNDVIIRGATNSNRLALKPTHAPDMIISTYTNMSHLVHHERPFRHLSIRPIVST